MDPKELEKIIRAVAQTMYTGSLDLETFVAHVLARYAGIDPTQGA